MYTINDDMLSKKDEIKFNKILKNLLPKHDLVIVSDYGHGLISKKSANLVCNLSKYLALNAQVNAANIGFHSIFPVVETVLEITAFFHTEVSISNLQSYMLHAVSSVWRGAFSSPPK